MKSDENVCRNYAREKHIIIASAELKEMQVNKRLAHGTQAKGRGRDGTGHMLQAKQRQSQDVENLSRALMVNGMIHQPSRPIRPLVDP